MEDGFLEPQRALTAVSDFVAEGLADGAESAALDAVAAEFKLRMTPAMRGAVRRAGDPVAAQFVPDAREMHPGLTHRYPDRVILHTTHSCEVYCRFCFRREVVGEDGPLPAADLEAALDYIAATPAIWEVILTGGDPMTLSPRRLRAIMDRLSAIPHVDVVRLHTRVPVVAPEKVTEALVAAITAKSGGRPVIYVVVHTNHAQELTDAARAALARLAGAGIPLLSQSVLLRGINDSVAALEDLFRSLIRNRVTPYYLHHCDLAKGTAHFRTTIAEGQALMAALRGRLSGICLPTYVLDIPGGHGKVPIGAGYLEPEGAGWQVTDWQGRTHRYDDPAR
ncbi:MAG: lysine 2,3-aminomutase [Rhodobacteraceae bacterium PARR1]|nr:MAG: lysine 2,3-aminomutase [Rhodobacteraceae bacterium PARR1]